MSEVMKALRRSEQGYQMSQLKSPLVKNQTRNSKTKGHWSLLMAVVLLPAVCSVSYQVHQAQQDWQEKRVQAERAQQEAERLAQQPVEPLVVQLDYPDFGELIRLSELTEEPEAAVKPVSESITQVISAEPKAAVLKANLTEADLSGTDQPDTETASELDLSSLDLSELSPELARRFQNVLDSDDTALKDSAEPEQEVVRLVESQRELKGRLPAMNLQYHGYSSIERSRWVKINGQELHEGEWLDNQVKLLDILPRNIVVEFEGLQIEIPALYEWEG